MIKLLLLILLGLALTFFGYKAFLSDKSLVVPGSENSQHSSPADAIEGAKGAVQQSQGVQNKVNNYAQDQLYQ